MASAAMPQPATTPPPPGSDAPLSESHYREIAAADRRARKLRRALSIANFHVWSLGIVGALSVLVGLFDRESLVVGIGLLLVAYNEHRGRAQLQRFDQRGPKTLGWNQIALGVLLIAYAAWKIVVGASASPYADQIKSDPNLAPMLEPIGQLHQTLTHLVYGVIIGVAFIYQGGVAWYYFSRGQHLKAYLEETPAWVVKLKGVIQK